MNELPVIDVSNIIKSYQAKIKQLYETKHKFDEALANNPVYATLLADIKSSQMTLEAAKDMCLHPNKISEYDKYDGCYDTPSRYWLDHTCPDCGKSWRTDCDYRPPFVRYKE